MDLHFKHDLGVVNYGGIDTKIPKHKSHTWYHLLSDGDMTDHQCLSLTHGFCLLSERMWK